MEGFDPPNNFGVPPPMPDPWLVLSAPLWRGKGREGRETQSEKRGSKEEKWKESWNRAADWLRPALRPFTPPLPLTYSPPPFLLPSPFPFPSPPLPSLPLISSLSFVSSPIPSRLPMPLPSFLQSYSFTAPLPSLVPKISISGFA